jgi:hypothetical protein
MRKKTINDKSFIEESKKVVNDTDTEKEFSNLMEEDEQVKIMSGEPYTSYKATLSNICLCNKTVGYAIKLKVINERADLPSSLGIPTATPVNFKFIFNEKISKYKIDRGANDVTNLHDENGENMQLNESQIDPIVRAIRKIKECT